MRGLLIVLMSATLAATAGFAQSRHGSGGGDGARVGARSFAGGAVRGGGVAGGGYGRGFVGSKRGFAGVGRAYAGGYGYRGYGYGLGYSSYYGPSCYGSYYYGAYNCGYPMRGYYAPPVASLVVPRGVMAPRAGVMVGGGWRRFGGR